MRAKTALSLYKPKIIFERFGGNDFSQMPPVKGN